MVYVMMGVSGSGKTAIGTALAARLGLPFHDGDEFHPPSNVAKMSAGIPLDDADREPWLRTLAERIREWNAAGGGVLACSALKATYRQRLREGGALRFIFLDAPKQLLANRSRQRTGHFMPATLLENQLATLEIPEDAIRVSDEGAVDATVAKILAAIETSSR